MIDGFDLWFVIIGLGLGSFGLRFLFTGLVGNRQMPAWVLRHLRYTGVAMLPALIGPMVAWPAATGGETEPARLIAAVLALVVAVITRNVILSILSGGGSFYLCTYLLG